MAAAVILRGAMLCAIIHCAAAAKGLDRNDEGRYLLAEAK
jgi:hypothetical protein